MRKDRLEIKRLYEEEGYSCTQIGRMFGITRQSAHETLTRVGTIFRKTKPLPFIMYDNLKWTKSKSTGYYRSTANRKTHVSLHCYVWEKHNGKIPKGWDIHHVDLNKEHNNIENLICLPKAEHTSLYSPHHNQFKNKHTIASGEWKKG